MRRIGAGRWLAWLAYLLIAIGVQVLVDIRLVIEAYVDGSTSHSLLYYVAPLLIYAACYIVAGLALLAWRKPAGFYVAFTLIWLSSVVSICGYLRAVQTGVAPAVAVTEFFFIILKSRVFDASGCSAFLLGLPGIQQAYGLMTASDHDVTSGTGGTATARSKICVNWLGVLCFFLLLPLLSLVSVIGNSFSETSAFWEGREVIRQMICLGFALPLVVAVIIVMKYRRSLGLILVISLLCLMPIISLLGMIPAVAPGYFWPAQVWKYISLLPSYFGFGLLGVFAWTAYLLSAPLLPATQASRAKESDIAS
jgi:hypothetical protein